MKSNYKVLNSLDLSRNDILNTSRIIGYDASANNDLEITTADSTTSGDLIVRAGAGSTPGKVHLLAGVVPTWTNGTVADSVEPRGGIPRGIILNPDSSISIVSDESSIVADATSITLRSSSDGSSTASNKTSIILTSSDNKVAIKDVLFNLTSSDDTTIATTDLTTVTSDKFNISSTSGKYSLVANSTTKPSSTINGSTVSYNSLLKIEAIDVAEKINAQKDVEIAGNLKVRNTSSSFSKDILIESNEWHLKSKDILEEYQGNTSGDVHYKLESNSSNHKLTIDNIKINSKTDINNLEIEGNFKINNSGSEYTRIQTPEYTSTVSTLSLNAGGTTPTLTVTANSTSSNVNVDYVDIDEKLEVSGVNKTTEADPAVDIRGALTVGKDTYLQGALRFDTSNGLITNDNSSKQITVQEDNVRITSTNTTITGTAIELTATTGSNNIVNIKSQGSISASLLIAAGVSDANRKLEIVSDTTTSKITVDNINVKVSSTFTGNTFNVTSTTSSINSDSTSVVGNTSLAINGPTNSGLSIQGTTNNSSITVKNLTVTSLAGIQALSVTGSSTLTGAVNINGDLNLTGNGVITSTNGSNKQIHIQANNIIDIRRSTSAGSTSNSILYADSSSTYLNASHLNLSTDLTYGKDSTYTSGRVHLTSTSTSIVIPTSIVANTTGAALNIQNTNSSGNALTASGNASINNTNSYTTTINGNIVNIKPSNLNLGITSTTVTLQGNNNLKIVSNDSSRGSFIQSNNIKAENMLNVNELAIYYDSNTNSVVFARGTL